MKEDKASGTVVVIPAYQPDEAMTVLLREIKSKTDYDIVVVNDGSSEDRLYLFEEAAQRAEVLSHQGNKGKGQALKTAFLYICKHYSEESIVITADADGQHRVEDIISLGQRMDEEEDLSGQEKAGQVLLLGCRDFKGDVPAKSKFGNNITRLVFRLTTGLSLSDTQTGLRAFRAGMIPMLLKTPGSRYEYETNMLLACAEQDIRIAELPIETIYNDNNSGTHFRAVRDSVRIYKDLLKFALSSLAAFLIDFSVYSLMIGLTGGMAVNTSLLTSNITARVVSASANFYINKHFVFRNDESLWITAAKYFCLAAGILCLNTLLLSLMVNYLIGNKYISKIVVETTMFIISWTVQRLIIFRRRSGSDKG